MVALLQDANLAQAVQREPQGSGLHIRCAPQRPVMIQRREHEPDFWIATDSAFGRENFSGIIEPRGDAA